VTFMFIFWGVGVCDLVSRLFLSWESVEVELGVNLVPVTEGTCQ
jgi:hypothetical protein